MRKKHIMKKIIPIVVIGRNGVFRKGGSPLYHNDHIYNDFFRTLVKDYPFILARSIYEGLPQKSSLFPCHMVYVIDNDHAPDSASIVFPQGVTNVMSVLTLTQPLMLCKEAEKIITLVTPCGN